MRIGFVPLIDAAPIIVAEARGLFREEGLEVSLHRQVGWANMRDKLSAYGHLDAGHALLGMPLASQLGRDNFGEPLLGVMSLGAGGNAITISKVLHERGVSSAADLANYLQSRQRGEILIAGHVFNSSTHHYLLREWLADAGIDPDKGVKLCVIPPPQMADHMKGHYLDLFCAGEPWNTVAESRGCGVAIVATTDIVPNHPEKLLAVRSSYMRQHPERVQALIRALLRATQWCDKQENRGALAAILAEPQYLGLPVSLLEASLQIDRSFGTNRHQRTSRPCDWNLRTFSPGLTCPNKTHMTWLLLQMMRWGHLHPEADVLELSERCLDTRLYRAACRDLGMACPDEEFRPMRMRRGREISRQNVNEFVSEYAAERRQRLAPSSATRLSTVTRGVV